MKKGILLAGIISFLVTTAVEAQKSRSFSSSTYKTALGIKLYPGSGGAAVTLKHFVQPNRAFEALGHAWERGGRLTGLYEFHFDIPGAPGLKWYVGPGAHISFYNDKNHHEEEYDEHPSYVAAGLDGVIGLDYKFNNIPLNLSLDWQPSVEFGDGRYNGFAGNYGGVSARYTF